LEDKEIKEEGGATQGEETRETPTSGAEETPETLRATIEKKEAEYKELHDKYLRALAEMENFRKRVAREQAESIKYANERILSDLLSVVDNIERAIVHSREKKDFDALIDGLNLTMKELHILFEKYGVKGIESVGQPFDPTKHHAVSLVESDTHPENIVVEEFRKGYLLNDRILRPSLVSVAKRKEGKKEEEEKEETGGGE